MQRLTAGRKGMVSVESRSGIRCRPQPWQLSAVRPSTHDSVSPRLRICILHVNKALGTVSDMTRTRQVVNKCNHQYLLWHGIIYNKGEWPRCSWCDSSACVNLFILSICLPISLFWVLLWRRSNGSSVESCLSLPPTCRFNGGMKKEDTFF